MNEIKRKENAKYNQSLKNDYCERNPDWRLGLWDVTIGQMKPYVEPGDIITFTYRQKMKGYEYETRNAYAEIKIVSVQMKNFFGHPGTIAIGVDGKKYYGQFSTDWQDNYTGDYGMWHPYGEEDQPADANNIGRLTMEGVTKALHLD